MNALRNKWVWIGSIFNTVVMLILTMYFWSLPWLAGDEKFLIWSSSLIKKHFTERPPAEEVALINVSYDLALIDKLDEFGFPVGQSVITDRNKLALFYRIMNEGNHPYKLMLTDIFFSDPSEDDTSLQNEISNLKKALFSGHLDGHDSVMASVFNATYGISDYLIANIFEGVYKGQLLFNDTLLHTSLKAIDENAAGFGPFVKVNQQYVPNHFIINYSLLQNEMLNPEYNYNPVNLGELLLLSDEDIRDFVKEKLVILGDFRENDMHETVFEITSGPLILLNVYYQLSRGNTTVGFFFMLILVLSYFLLSLLVILPEDPVRKFLVNRFGESRVVSKLLSGITFYSVSLSVLSFCLFFLFNIHINAFFIGLYCYGVDWLVYRIDQKRKPSV
ncbi:MAG: hypothetical protein AAFQ94_13950 [Bacteroidota bacterium]